MFEQVKNILIRELKIAPDLITPDSELASDLGINSIELADLVLTCEEEFDLNIDERKFGKMITVGDVISYLEALKN